MSCERLTDVRPKRQCLSAEDAEYLREELFPCEADEESRQAVRMGTGCTQSKAEDCGLKYVTVYLEGSCAMWLQLKPPTKCTTAWRHFKQECIPVGCVPPAHWPYATHSIPPRMPPCHACPPTTHAPLPHTPPTLWTEFFVAGGNKVQLKTSSSMRTTSITTGEIRKSMGDVRFSNILTPFAGAESSAGIVDQSAGTGKQ